MKQYIFTILLNVILFANQIEIIESESPLKTFEKLGNENGISCTIPIENNISVITNTKPNLEQNISIESIYKSTLLNKFNNNDFINYSNFNVLEFRKMNTITDKKEQSINGFSFDTYNDFKFKNSGLSLYTNLNYLYIDSPVFNTVKGEPVNAPGVLTLTEFRLKYSFDSQISASVGIIPLYRGMSYKYDSFNFTRNDGSYYVSGLILQGVEAIYRDCKNKFYITAGHGYYEKWDINKLELHNDKVKGSDGTYLFFKKFNDISGDISIEQNIEASHINYKYDGILGFSQNIYGYNLSASNDTHFIWSFIGYQKGQGNNTPLVRYYKDIPSNIPDSAIQIDNDKTFIGPYTVEGFSNAFGYKYSFDLFRKENFILIEDFRTYGNWVAPTYGEPFSEYGLGRLGKQKKIVVGHFINTELLIKFVYNNMKYEKIYKNGGSMVQTDIDNFPNLSTRERTYSLVLQYLF